MCVCESKVSGRLFKQMIFTARKRSLGRGNIFIGVCQEFCSQGGCMVLGVVSQHALRQTPPGTTQPLGSDTPPGPDTPRDYTHPPGLSTPPPAQSMLQDTVNVRAVRILLECNLVSDNQSTYLLKS